MKDMRINRKKVRKMRVDRAWTQNELAVMADLSLRTIQRIENAGLASIESLKALAAVFEVTSASLVTKTWSPVSVMAAVGVLLMGGLMFILPASADPIMLNLKMHEADQLLADVQLLNNDDVSELRINENLNLLFTAKQVETDKIKISLKIHRMNGETLSAVATPEVITKNKVPAAIHFDGIILEITPEL